MNPAPFGRYELLRCLAAGGMGEVFLARQAGPQGFEKRLVVKVLLPHLVGDPQALEMFLDEARLAAQLNHPNVAQIFDLGEEAGVSFIAMEYVQGEGLGRILAQALRQGAKPPLPLVARMIADAAAGLDYAHQATDAQGAPLGIVHRDVSPQNVLVSFEGVVKVIDFGIAKAVGRTVKTQTGTLRGKAPYLSPEQVLGKPLDRRSDVFSLGILLWELVTGARLFQADTDVQTLMRVARGEIAPPSSLDPAVDPALERIVLRALARDPAARFQTAGELGRELERWLAQQPGDASVAAVGEYLRGLFPQGDSEAKPVPSAFLDRLARAPREAKKGRGPLLALVGAGVLAAVGGAWFALRPKAVPEAWLQVETSPAGATVELDGRPVGTTPLARVPLVPGRHAEVTVSLAGREPVVRTVKGVGTVALDLTLGPARSAPRAAADARVREGLALSRDRRWEEAVGVLEQAVAAAPDHPAGLAALGAAYRELGRFEEAATVLRRAAQGAGDAASYLELARALARKGDGQDALRALETAVQRGLSEPCLLVHPDFQSLLQAPAFRELTRIAAEGAGGAGPEGEAPLVTPAEESRLAGEAALRKGDPRGAVRHFAAFLALAPEHPKAAWYQAVVDRYRSKRR